MPTYKLDPIAAQLEQRIRNNRLFDLPVEWADECLFPSYDGLSLHNISQQIGHLLGTTTYGSDRLDDALWGDEVIESNIDRVVVYISDGLGYKFLRQLINEDPQYADALDTISGGRGILPLSSVMPSTTATALPTLWHGITASQHGMFGSRLWLREASSLAKILDFAPEMGNLQKNALVDWGVSPSEFVSQKTLPQHLADVGVPTYLLHQRELMNSGLSLVMHRGIEPENIRIHLDRSDFWLRFSDILEETRGTKSFVSIYNPSVDALSHFYGAHGRELKHEINLQLQNLVRILNNPAVQDGRTLFLLIADHGHYDLSQSLVLDQDPRIEPLYQAMRSNRGGEARFAYLYLRPNTVETVKSIIENELADSYTYLEGPAAIDGGLFGDPTHLHPEAYSRVGDIVLLARQDHYLHHSRSKNTSKSRHGGLSDWEMLTPLIWNFL